AAGRSMLPCKAPGPAPRVCAAAAPTHSTGYGLDAGGTRRGSGRAGGRPRRPQRRLVATGDPSGLLLRRNRSRRSAVDLLRSPPAAVVPARARGVSADVGVCPALVQKPLLVLGRVQCG